MDLDQFNAEAFEQERSEIIRRVRYKDSDPESPTEIHHYTSFDAATKIIQSDRLWLSHLFFLNDPTEFRYGHDIMQTATERYNIRYLFREWDIDWFIYGGVQPYVFCLSQAEDSLTQWEMYSGRNGCCISFGSGIKKTAFKGHPSEGTLIKVIYDTQVQENLANGLCEHLVKHLKFAHAPDFKKQAFASLMNCVMVVKNPIFEHEQEWRLVYLRGCESAPINYRAGKRFSVPYVEGCHKKLPIRAIKIGPTPDRERLIRSMKHVTYMKGHDEIKVENSNIAFAPP